MFPIFNTGTIMSVLSEMKDETSRIQRPDYVEKFFMYDITAKQALIDLYEYFANNQVSLPLFEDRLVHGHGDKGEPFICVAVPTMRRKNSPISYLIQSISALLNRMDYKNNKNRVYIHVFNVDPNPEEHFEVELIRPLVPVTVVKAPLDANGAFKPNFLHHENMDYSLIIKHLHQLGCKYPIIGEDDAIVTPNWVSSVMHAAEQLEHRPVKDDWMVTKLYITRDDYSKPYNRGIQEYDIGWNSVANMFNRKHMLEITKDMEATTLEAIKNQDDSKFLITDHSMNFSAKRLKLRFLSYEPVVFQHTGIFSAVRNRLIDRESVEHRDMQSRRFDGDQTPVVFDRTMWES
jgi:hypothetical protein